MLFFTLKDISDSGVMSCFMDEEICGVTLKEFPDPNQSAWKRVSGSAFVLSFRLEPETTIECKT